MGGVDSTVTTLLLGLITILLGAILSIIGFGAKFMKEQMQSNVDEHKLFRANALHLAETMNTVNVHTVKIGELDSKTDELKERVAVHTSEIDTIKKKYNRK